MKIVPRVSELSETVMTNPAELFWERQKRKAFWRPSPPRAKNERLPSGKKIGSYHYLPGSQEGDLFVGWVFFGVGHFFILTPPPKKKKKKKIRGPSPGEKLRGTLQGKKGGYHDLFAGKGDETEFFLREGSFFFQQVKRGPRGGE